MILLEIKTPVALPPGPERRPLLKLIGLRILSFVDKQFQSSGVEGGSPWAPLRPSTLAMRPHGGNQPLRDVAAAGYAGSFTSQLDSEDSVWVGSRNPVGPFHEYGTRPYEIRSVRAKVLAGRMRAGGWMIFGKTVHHPGLPVRAVFPNASVIERFVTQEAQSYVENLLGGH